MKTSKAMSTLPCRVRWASVKKPDKYGRYYVTIIMDPKDADVKAWHKQALAQENALRKANGLPAVKKLTMLKNCENKSDKDDLEGMVEASFKMKSVRQDGTKNKPPRVVGPNRKPTSNDVWRNDLVKVGFALGYYNTGSNIGITTYLNAVQLLESNARGSSVEDYFDVEEGYDADGIETGAAEEEDEFGDDTLEDGVEEADDDLL